MGMQATGVFRVRRKDSDGDYKYVYAIKEDEHGIWFLVHYPGIPQYKWVEANNWVPA